MEQKPFFAGTYFPKQGRYGQFGLVELLERVAYLWKNERQALLRAGNEIAHAINQGQSGNGQGPDRVIVVTAYNQLQRRFDHKWGGFGAAPKFPAPHNLLFLMRYAHVMQEPDALKMAAVTLEDMARGGIHDHIGGGFSRYSTDEKWLVPHFEKMLYDNALLLMAYVTAYQQTKEEQFADVARRTADYILRELTDEQGGYFMTASDGEQLIARPKETYDGAIPSGNSAAAMALQRLASLTGEIKCQDAADRQMAFLAAAVGEYPASSCFGVLAMMDALYPHRELVCAVKDGLPDELLRYLKENPADDIQVLLKTESNAEALAQCAPLVEDSPIPETGAVYYLCENGACKAPVKSLTGLGIEREYRGTPFLFMCKSDSA